MGTTFISSNSIFIILKAKMLKTLQEETDQLECKNATKGLQWHVRSWHMHTYSTVLYNL